MPKRRSRRKHQNLDLIWEEGAHSMAAESYRTLRTNIALSQVDKPLRTMLVTSCIPREGKSTTAANLGVTFALAQQKVLIIDADLRRPILHRLFGVPNTQGLTHALSDAVEFDQGNGWFHGSLAARSPCAPARRRMDAIIHQYALGHNRRNWQGIVPISVEIL